jgi:hypothetical protein
MIIRKMSNNSVTFMESPEDYIKSIITAIMEKSSFPLTGPSHLFGIIKKNNK